MNTSGYRLGAASRGDAIDAWLGLDVRQRQISVLRNTFPHWEIRYDSDTAGCCVWSAVVPRELTVEMVTAGALHGVRRSDPIALMAALTMQAAILERFLQSQP